MSSKNDISSGASEKQEPVVKVLVLMLFFLVLGLVFCEVTENGWSGTGWQRKAWKYRAGAPYYWVEIVFQRDTGNIPISDGYLPEREYWLPGARVSWLWFPVTVLVSFGCSYLALLLARKLVGAALLPRLGRRALYTAIAGATCGAAYGCCFQPMGEPGFNTFAFIEFMVVLAILVACSIVLSKVFKSIRVSLLLNAVTALTFLWGFRIVDLITGKKIFSEQQDWRFGLKWLQLGIMTLFIWALILVPVVVAILVVKKRTNMKKGIRET